MSDVKLLNLDDLAAIKRVVQFKGKEYDVAEQSIGQMIKRLALGKQANEDFSDPEVFLKNMRQTAQDILPTAPKAVIESMNLTMITRLVEFLNDKELNETAERIKEVGEPTEGKYAEPDAEHKTEAGDSEKKS